MDSILILPTYVVGEVEIAATGCLGIIFCVYTFLNYYFCPYRIDPLSFTSTSIQALFVLGIIYIYIYICLSGSILKLIKF